MGAPRLLLITPPQPQPDRLHAVLPALHGAVDAILLRFPHAPAREVTRLASRLAALQPRPALLVSDRFDVARAAGIDGVHLREDGLPSDRVRIHGPGLLVGVSRHEGSDLRNLSGADYTTLSPVFPTPSKPGASGLGIEGLARACGLTSVPVLALGGIVEARVEACIAAGAFGVAVISAVWNAPCAVGAAWELRRTLDRSIGSV